MILIEKRLIGRGGNLLIGQSDRELYTLVNKMANVLSEHGVVRGDRVAIYMPTCPMAVAVMLASARIGAVHSVIFAGFSAEALASRVNDAQAVVVITCDQVIDRCHLVHLISVTFLL